MVLADDLVRIMSLNHEQLTTLVKRKNKKFESQFNSSKFLGLTTGGEFCFAAHTDAGRVEKLFVVINNSELEVNFSQ